VNKKEAYIVGGVPSVQDIRISDLLKVPYYGIIEEARKIQGSAGLTLLNSLALPIPLYISNLTDMQDLYQDFSSLIAQNLQLDYWVFKIDHEPS
jgi:hypothetical protein